MYKRQAILYNKNRCTFKERKIKGNRFEIISGIAKLVHNTRPWAVIVVYIPPDSLAESYHAVLKLVGDEIAKLKSELNDPYITVGGDFNGRNIGEAIGDFPDLGELTCGPTRGSRTLDKIATNYNSECIEQKILPPLATEDGTPSDHCVAVVSTKLQHTHRFHWREFKTRKITPEGERKFGALLAAEDWNDVYHLGPCEAATLLTTKLNSCLLYTSPSPRD